MDSTDRDLEKAEGEAGGLASHPYGETSGPSGSARPGSVSSSSSGSSTSSALSERQRALSQQTTRSRVPIGAGIMSRNTTRGNSEPLSRRSTHPTEMHRLETHRLQHVGTVGADKASKSESRASRRDLPAFGGGKDYPPLLPAQDEYVVEFDGHDDPMHPQNWPLKTKLIISVIQAWTCLCSTFSSSIFSAATSYVARDFGVSGEVAILSTSLYVLGYAFGPLVWGPLSELRGRKMPIIIGMFGFSIFNIAVAVAKDLQTIMLCRFFGGVFGSCPLSIVAAVFADMYNNETRGTAITMFASMVFLGPMLGPFIGGFIVTSYLGWRWTAYIPAFMGFLSFTLNVLFFKETYPPMVLVEKAADLRRRTKNWGIHAKQEEVEIDFRELVTKNFTRPIRMLIQEPVIICVSLYMSFIYGLLYAFLGAYPLIFGETYGMSPGVAGLPFFGLVVGLFIIAGVIIALSPSYNRKLHANGGIPIPEWRLPPVILGGALFSAGLFWLGWTGFTPSIPWIVPTLSGLFTGFGLLAIFIGLFNYLIDTYLMFAASAIAANTLMRSAFGAAFPLFTQQMFHNLGIQWAGTLLGCLALVCVPIPILFYFFGAKLRQKSKFAPTLPRKDVSEETEAEQEGWDSERHDEIEGITSRLGHESREQRVRSFEALEKVETPEGAAGEGSASDKAEKDESRDLR
ncbi:MFS transporter [Aulographum hederae CBS 113979]|uniref:MFS transporter n=1 Tax=Aulographum hederae CBS 113979 TaxID=1176131 RepID=A0A6G1HER8_9PEZI|nr:MFS transporter [Aulographum hederae CBS 113979]